MQTVETCPFCEILNTPSQARTWYDVSLYEDDDFVVIPGLGPQSDVYLLVIPRLHVYSIGQLPSDLINRLEDLVGHIEDALAPVFGPTAVFEHGSCDADSRKGACIDHAHLHVLSTELPLALTVATRDDLASVSGLHDLSRFRETPYVFVRDRLNGQFAGAVTSATGQHVRRIFAELNGRPDNWDYEVLPETERIRQLIKTAGPLLQELESGRRA